MRNHIFKGFVWFLCEFTISIYRENIDALEINKYNLDKIMSMYDMSGGVWCGNRRN